MQLDYQIQRSRRRKTVAIHIKRGAVKILAPHWLPSSEIESLVEQKQAWISQKLAEQNAVIAQEPEHLISNDSQFTLFGKPLKLTVLVSKRTQYEFNADNYSLTLSVSSRVKPENQQAYLQKLLETFYSQQLTDYLQHRLPLLADNMGLIYQSWQVKNFKAKWGSCNSLGQLAFNWRIALAAMETVDSVVIHELAHLKYMNHSAAFWRFVARFDPLYKLHKVELTSLGRQIWF